MDLRKLLDFFKQLIEHEWSGEIKIFFHKGNMSKKLKKEEDVFIDG